MKIENSIGWCDETGNKVTGCDKKSPGCKNCYAQVGTRARVLRAQGIETWGPKGQRYPVKDFSTKVRRLNKLCVCDKCHEARPWHPQAIGERCRNYAQSGPSSIRCNGTYRRIRIFADSNSDWLDDKWPIETLADLLKDIHDCPNLDFQLLTKRPENWKKRLQDVVASGFNHNEISEPAINWLYNNGAPLNMWIGVSIEDQKRADERIPLLLQIPAKVRFLSVEPLLEKVDIARSLRPARDTGNYNPINWVIIGGESGKDRRDCGVEAICDVANQCFNAGVPCFVKQDCAFKPGQQGRIPDDIWKHTKQFPR